MFEFVFFFYRLVHRKMYLRWQRHFSYLKKWNVSGHPRWLAYFLLVSFSRRLPTCWSSSMLSSSSARKSLCRTTDHTLHISRRYCCAFSFLHDLRRSTTGDLRQGRIDSVRTRTSGLSYCSLPFHRARVSGSLCSFTWSSSWNNCGPLNFRHLLRDPRQVLFVKLIIQYLIASLLYAIIDDLGKLLTRRRLLGSWNCSPHLDGAITHSFVQVFRFYALWLLVSRHWHLPCILRGKLAPIICLRIDFTEAGLLVFSNSTPNERLVDYFCFRTSRRSWPWQLRSLRSTLCVGRDVVDSDVLFLTHLFALSVRGSLERTLTMNIFSKFIILSFDILFLISISDRIRWNSDEFWR